MRADVRGDEIVITVDLGEFPFEASDSQLRAGLPYTAHDIATEICSMLQETPKAPEHRTVHSVTVRLIRHEVIAAETLLLDQPREVWAS